MAVKGKLRLVLSVGFAAIALVCCLGYARSARAEAQQARRDALDAYGGEVVSVVVANHALQPGSELVAADVEVRDWLVDLVPEGALTSAEQAVGKRVSSPVARGAVLTQLSFADAAELVSVPSGKVAFTVALTDRIGITAQVEVGTSVVAYATTERESRLLSADAQVLAVRPKEGGQAASVTLAVPPADVTGLLSASVRESLRLVLPADDVTAIPDGGGDEGQATRLSAPLNVPAQDPDLPPAADATAQAPGPAEG